MGTWWWTQGRDPTIGILFMFCPSGNQLWVKIHSLIYVVFIPLMRPLQFVLGDLVYDVLMQYLRAQVPLWFMTWGLLCFMLYALLGIMKKSYTFSLIKLIQELLNRLEMNLSALKSLRFINDIQGCYKIYDFHVLKVIKISFTSSISKRSSK